MSSVIERRVAQPIAADLPDKMVLLSGPRQCGKTTLVKALVDAQEGRYYSWDRAPDRLAIQKRNLDFDRTLWAFDELHKFRRWRAFLKDLTDSFGRERQLMVTGSARLETYGHGGDSLQGRYLPHHLHPVTYSELCGLPFGVISDIPLLGNAPPARRDLGDLLRRGGFPEPLLAGSDRAAARWRLAYGARLVEEEVASLEQVRELERIELLFDRLSDVAGGLLSINSLRADLEVAFETARSWIAILERLDAVFRLPPYGSPRIKAVKKEQKLYFWDWARCSSDGARFENLLALHLLRAVHWAADVEGEKLQLRYWRHRAGREVDFVILRGRRPWLAVEAKLTESDLAPGLRYFIERLQPEVAFQVVLDPARERRLPDIGGARVEVVSAARFLANLP
ncbi:MAG: ATP-binding protein [Deltaproteobacteria bacterium]|nr:ATP-binding protein [Deltaproteobacteria bacterium]